jgi:hypothetical protein
MNDRTTEAAALNEIDTVVATSLDAAARTNNSRGHDQQ